MKAHQISNKALAGFIGMLSLAGCTSMTPVVDAHFGDSLNIIKAQQTIDPNAANNTKAVAVDGQAANDALQRYYKSYSVPTPQTNIFTIGVGGGRGG